jgi:cyclase
MIRIIPRLDIKGLNVVKGLCFDGYRVLGTADRLAELYYKEGADELFIQDVVASLYERNNLLDFVSLAAEKVRIPITVAGGIRSVDNIGEVLRAGADKVAINTAAIKDPSLIERAAKKFGSQCIVLSIEAKRRAANKYEAWTDYGRQPTGVDVFEWALQVENLGAGEIYLSSVDRDGSGEGYDLELINEVSLKASIPVIASSGAGSLEDVSKAVLQGNAEAVSAASVFHYHYFDKFLDELEGSEEGELRMGRQEDLGNIEFIKEGYGGFNAIQVDPFSIRSAKEELKKRGVAVRLK